MTTVGAGTAGVAVVIDGPVLRITLDRPERRNALDTVSVGRIVATLESVATDDMLRAIVLDSTGRDFCSGADWVASNRDAARPRTGALHRRTRLQAHRLIELLTLVELPVVCSVRGWAAGLGCQLALAADFTIASEGSTFWEPFAERGFTPDSGASWLLPRLVGIARAKELLILGRKLTGAEAAAWGIIHRVVPDDELETETSRLVERLAAGPTVAIGLAKRCIHRSLETGLVEAMDHEALALELSSRSADFREGLVAFRERRTAHFEGQ